MRILDSLIDGPLLLGGRREGDELIGMIVRYLRTGDEPEPRTDAQRAILTAVRPVMETSRSRIVAGSSGGSKTAGDDASKQPSKMASKPTSKRPSKTGSKMTSKSGSSPDSKQTSKPTSKAPSDIYSSSYTPESPSKGEGCGEGDAEIPYDAIVGSLNGVAGTSFRPSSEKTRRLIRARWAEGYRLPDFEAVVAAMAARWRGDAKMSAYLRPETLFGPKFEGYRELARQAAQTPGGGAAGDEYSRL